MIRHKKGFTLIEVILVMAIFSMASVIIFSLFSTNYMRMEAQGRETYLQQDIDRGLTQLSNRLMGITEITSKTEDDKGQNTMEMIFKYYYKDNNTPYEGKLDLVEKAGVYTLKLHSKRDSDEDFTNTLMSYLEGFKINLIDENGVRTNIVEDASALEINYTVSTSYKKIVKKKDGNLTIKLRNMR